MSGTSKNSIATVFGLFNVVPGRRPAAGVQVELKVGGGEARGADDLKTAAKAAKHSMDFYPF